jgi:ankyrin repeat protein
VNSVKKLITISLIFMSGYSAGMELDLISFDQAPVGTLESDMSGFNGHAHDYTAELFELCQGRILLVDANGNYAPYYAQKRGVLDGRTRYFHFCGADINSQDAFGKTPLHMVAENGFDEIAETLVSLNVNSKIKNNKGETALHTALRYGKSYIASLLLENDKRLVEEKDNNGNPPLHVAVESGVSSILVKDLLENNGKFMILHENNCEQNAINIAEKRANGAIYKLLLDCILANPSLLEG